MTKVYQLRRRYAAYFETTYCGIKVPLTFTAGIGNAGEYRAELTTSDRFVQDAVEHDPRFGKEFFIAEQYGEPDPEPEPIPEPETEKPKKTAKKAPKKDAGSSEGIVFENTNEALYFMIDKGETATEETLPKLLEKYNATIKA